MTKFLDNSILIIGYGAQAKAWALNFRDSGYAVNIGLRANSQSTQLAREAGFNVIDLDIDRLDHFQFLCFLTPDNSHNTILKNISNKLSTAQSLIFAHGFSVYYEKLDELYPHLNFLLLAPKAIASEVRFNFETKAPLTAVVDETLVTHFKEETQEAFEKLCKGLGVNIGPIHSSFKEEAEADLFSEQSILCSLIPFGARKSFEKLVQNGISEEIAYIECWHEVKLIANAMIKIGPQAFFSMISPNALLGGIKASELIFDKEMDRKLTQLFNDIKSGDFYRQTTHTDFQSLQSTVLNDWENTRLQQIYNTLGRELGKNS
ncbi:acetohydroxy acid isomeroreductase catalytic domain protein [Bacteriovorax sp. Seq25_V]|uniref:acetohydroxy acid isomeroreductase catalytic domain protein n=1 Tax=Bacteriovorax sp. Seq25_V TaxID=1201288 RepID=UPI00038A4828|nr:acetohydroxy acid isomeroreductase catalytic domain protein [Bacteriovorax sp. Seq25_V]EQC47539.1 acetohydroxy acid isomeroreductase, catalytic domain protein [Bacteriovorax sp. Seq25_V]